MKNWEVIIEFSSHQTQTRYVEAPSEKEARSLVWKNLDDDVKDRVSDIEVFEINL